jgi:farnesyl-diphosphate farnesyltransferase
MITLGQLLGPILRDVSRSFFISIRLLPRRLREPIGLAYLLARTTDSLADSGNVPLEARIEALQKLAAVIQQDDGEENMRQLSKSFDSFQPNASERRLLDVLPDCLRMLSLLNPADRADIRNVLSSINRGQLLDLQRFGESATIQALPTAAELDQYTYLVAGCVGEFWTALCSRYLEKFSRKSEAEMARLGVQYGKALQLINILRDLQADLASGRCYLPADELSAAGLKPADIMTHSDTVLSVYRKWLDLAQAGLEAGMDYILAIEHFRVRAATALPAIIGAKTLTLLRDAGTGAVQKKLKISRKEVRGTVAAVALTLAGRDSLRAMFKRASGDG